MTRHFATAMALLLFVACDSKGSVDRTNEEAQSSPHRGTIAAEDRPTTVIESERFEPFEYDESAIATYLPRGEPSGGAAFRDGAGTNYLAFALDERVVDTKPVRIIRLVHLRGEGEDLEQVTSREKSVDPCSTDATLAVARLDEWSTTDLDSDGVGEFTYALTTGCRDTEEPLEHEVVIMEDGRNFTRRGTPRVRREDGRIDGGTFVADSLPKDFKEHVERVWNETSQLEQF